MSVEKYLKRIDGCCDVCAFKNEGLCTEMMSPYDEPLCARLSDNQLAMRLRDCIDEINGDIADTERYYEKKEQEEQEKKWKKEEAKKKRKESYYYCYTENYEIKELRRKIRRCYKSIQAVGSLRALGEALSFANMIINQEDNELIKEREKYWESRKDIYREYIKNAEERIKQLNKIKKEKLKARRLKWKN